MYKKQALILILILLFSFSCKKKNKENNIEKNLDKVMLKGEFKFRDGSIHKSLIKDRGKIVSNFNAAYNSYLKNSGQEGNLKKDITLLSKKLKKFDNIKFWLRKDLMYKIELNGINIIDIIETFYSPMSDKVESFKDIEYIWLDKSKKLILASRKNISVISMKIDIDEIFTYQEPESIKDLETITNDNKNNFDFYLAFYNEKLFNDESLPYFFRSFKSGLFKVFYEKNKKENKFQLLAHLGKDESVDAKIYLNSLYKQYLPIALEKIKEFKVKFKNNKEFNSNIPKKDQKIIFKAIENSIKNIDISYKDKYLTVNINLKGLNEESARLSNIAIIGIFTAIAIPAYQEFAMKSQGF